jgi:hypothetical protein
MITFAATVVGMFFVLYGFVPLWANVLVSVAEGLMCGWFGSSYFTRNTFDAFDRFFGRDRRAH